MQLLIHFCCIQIYVTIHVCLADQSMSTCPSLHLTWEKLKVEHYTHYVFSFSLILLYLLCFLTALNSAIFYNCQWPWNFPEGVGVGSTRSAQTKTCFLQFFTHFKTDQNEICCCDKADKGEAVLLVVSKTLMLAKSMQLDVNELILFELGRMLIKSSLIEVQVTLTLIQCLRDAREQNLVDWLSYKVLNELGWNLVCFLDF